jgi:hypothetical protein
VNSEGIVGSIPVLHMSSVRFDTAKVHSFPDVEPDRRGQLGRFKCVLTVLLPGAYERKKSLFKSK